MKAHTLPVNQTLSPGLLQAEFLHQGVSLQLQGNDETQHNVRCKLHVTEMARKDAVETLLFKVSLEEVAIHREGIVLAEDLWRHPARKGQDV